MKKLLLALALCGLLVLPTWAMAGEKTLTFQWNQTLSDDFAGWRLYKSEVAGGPYAKHGNDILFVSEQPVYESAQALTSPDAETHIYYFVLTAFDTSGNESGFSNEVNARIDFESPGSPFTLKVTVTTP